MIAPTTTVRIAYQLDIAGPTQYLIREVPYVPRSGLRPPTPNWVTLGWAVKQVRQETGRNPVCGVDIEVTG